MTGAARPSVPPRSFWRGPSSGVGQQALVLLAYTAVTLVATWPLAAHLGSRIGGEMADPWQTLWGFWWFRYSHAFGGSPMFTPLLWWPDGAPLWFQTWDLPSTLAVWPLWGHVPAFALYNLTLLATFPLAGWTFQWLARELWGGRLGPFLAGGLYTFSTYHFAHARMQLHIASLEWAPLYFLFLIRGRRTGRTADAALGGLALAGAFLASTYHFVFCVLGTLVLALSGTLGDWRTLRSRAVVRQAAWVAGVFLVIGGWLLAGMIHAYVLSGYAGTHDAVRFSADLQSFVLPNGISVWSRWLQASSRWTGNEFEVAAYVGVVTFGLAIFAAWRLKLARGYLALAVVGAVLALGPLLHVGGSVSIGMLLPEAWLELFVPPFRLSGMPARFSWLTLFGTTVAAGASLSWLAARGRRGVVLAVALTVAALVETWPRPFVLTNWPEPAIFTDWAADRSNWTVLDGTPWSRGLWHQMAHHHPLVTGYISRTPQDSWNRVYDEPALRPFLDAQFGATPVQTADPADALRAFHRLRVRFVIVDASQTNLVDQFGLAERYRGDGIVIFEVP
jgi:hypothetical protein